MSLSPITPEQLIAQWHQFDTLIDARSESEYALDHLPGAVNWPTLNDEQRIAIGTTYKQVNAFEAKKRGAAVAASNIAAHINQYVIDKPRDWKPLAYCWRGGKRSGSLSLILSEIGFKVQILEGGYKAFRVAMLLDLGRLTAQHAFKVICGTTGSGKTRLLQALSQQGAQVLDLEEIAKHRGSVLGALAHHAQPSQKHFDMCLWNALRHLDLNRPVFVEAESKKVGNISLPETLITRMRASPCINLDLPLPERVELLIEDYQNLVQDPAYFCDRLSVLVQQRGSEKIDEWKTKVRQGHMRDVSSELLTLHYDPVYLQSMRRNFKGFDAAPTVRPKDRSNQSMRDIALELLDGSATPP